MNIVPYTVNPNLPEPLAPLSELARNLWLSWNFDAVSLFIRLDYDAWLASRQNPVRTLGMVPQERLEELAEDDSYLSALQSVYDKFRKYLSSETWYSGPAEDVVAYFSMEYGLDVSLPIYSGGLGILSGDHLKTASDLGLPLVAVGLLYRQGYFQQYLNADGYQQESYPENDWYNMPVRRCQTKDGDDVKITVKMADAVVTARVWEVKIGRVSLYLLDTNIDENDDAHKEITGSLYGGNRENRIRQEILLGIGGIRALRACGYNPAVAHMNEGHSAFLGLERIREFVQNDKLSTKEAIQAVWPTSIFTTHTPVPAGNERFDVQMMEKYFHSLTDGTGLDWHDFMALGRENPEDTEEHFCMTVLAIKLSAYNNGVSKLHGDISRDMWKAIWPGLPEEEIPIGSITNGVHARTFESHDMVDLLDRYFGPRFSDEPTHLDIWDRMDRISDEELWRVHERRKSRLVAFVRDRLRQQLKGRGITGNQIAHANEVLSPTALTISFARRFATYKRATLLFRDPERLRRLLTDPERPIQLIFSGKAHPHDVPGKNLIRDIVKFATQPELRSKIVFLENYDLTTAKYLVSGSDLWLNTPRRPLEASGTSGMKAAVNGVLNCSTLDGWWAEAYDPTIGWAIGNGEEYEDTQLQDEIESKALYDLLEREIIPTFFDRGQDGLPRTWISMMKRSMRSIGKQFASHRMLMEYHEQFYSKALENYKKVIAEKDKRPKEVAAYLEKLNAAWNQVSVVELTDPGHPELHVGENLEISADINLGPLSPEQLRVEAYFGRINSQGGIEHPQTTEMKPRDGQDAQAGTLHYVASVPCDTAGRQGYSVRILPKHPELTHNLVPGYVKWA
ncbi:MAG: alpha-glucan family phosphorylase [Spirochaetes bacterium]|jgi:starch phosphorylase|nr:alpha-glucan family phosphorylase [Spirochaetota bacterium]